MFKHAVRHAGKKARTDIRNNSDLTPLTLAAKLGRKELFLECLELAQVVNYSFNIFSSPRKISRIMILLYLKFLIMAKNIRQTDRHICVYRLTHDLPCLTHYRHRNYAELHCNTSLNCSEMIMVAFYT